MNLIKYCKKNSVLCFLPKELKVNTTNLIFIIILFMSIIIYFMFQNNPSKNYHIYPHNNLKWNNKEAKELSKETFHSKEKVLFFMSIDYPEIPEYGKLTIKSLQNYCNKHNYTFKLFNHYKDKNKISPYWIRVKDFKEQLDSGNYSTIIYFDLDVIINPFFFNTKINSLINKINTQSSYNWDMYLAIDPYRFNYEMNTGVIIVKNTDWTKNFINLWLNNYPQDFWKKQNSGKWECKGYNNNCLWAGDEYEQGMLNRLYDRNVLNCKNHIIPVPYKLFGNNKISNNSFIYHFMGLSSESRKSNILKLYPELNI
jgi:hypothetical protein